MTLPDPATVAYTVGGALIGVIGTVAVAFLNRGPALQQAVTAQLQALLQGQQKTIDDLRGEIRALKLEIHELRTRLEEHGIEPSWPKAMRPTVFTVPPEPKDGT